MSKRTLVTLLIFLILGVLAGILFGTVFCLRDQKVVVKGDTPVNISREEIISTAGLKNGESIFMIDKTKAINNLEKKFENIKVIQIKTTSVTKIEIIIRARHEMFYSESNNSYYILDEELKVLDMYAKNLENEPSNQPTDLTLVQAEALNINLSTQKCDFVGTDYQQQTTKALLQAVTNNVKSVDGENISYYTRSDFVTMFQNMEFKDYSSFNKIILTTSYGVKLDIENPTENLTNKMNICLSTIQEFIKGGENKEKGGTIKIYYDLNNSIQSVYVPESE